MTNIRVKVKIVNFQLIILLDEQSLKRSAKDDIFEEFIASFTFKKLKIVKFGKPQ